MITLRNVSKSFRAGDQAVTVFDCIDMSIADGDVTALQAPSGTGKSTLLNLIGCIDNIDTGVLKINDIDVSTLSDSEAARLRNRQIGFVFQSFHLIPVLTALENVEYPLQLMHVSRPDRRARAKEVLRRVGLDSHLDKIPAHLSGGQRQRVAIARALVHRPSIVLADEPTANLDQRTGKDIMALITELNAADQVTFLIATHDPMVADHCLRRLTISNGKVIDV